MGVTYKLKDEVVHFIISQRQGNPLFSCRQLAESASEKFGVHLSKSSVHDVLKESGIITPRGRKPKEKFEIPQEKKKQIQNSLSQVNVNLALVPDAHSRLSPPNVLVGGPVQESIDSRQKHSGMTIVGNSEMTQEILPEYEWAGKVFLKAALWDLGVFSEENIKEEDWKYYLTYAKGIKVLLKNNKSFFINLPLPLERCIREVADGLINNTKPFIVNKVSDQELFKACMDAQIGFNIEEISIVDSLNHVLLVLSSIMEHKRNFILYNRVFVENYEKNIAVRSRAIFLSQTIENEDVMNNILNIKGFDAISKDELIVNLIIDENYNHKVVLQEAVERLNRMFIYDEQGRLLKVKIGLSS